jgi:hypothetical protein
VVPRAGKTPTPSPCRGAVTRGYHPHFRRTRSESAPPPEPPPLPHAGGAPIDFQRKVWRGGPAQTKACRRPRSAGERATAAAHQKPGAGSASGRALAAAVAAAAVGHRRCCSAPPARMRISSLTRLTQAPALAGGHGRRRASAPAQQQQQVWQVHSPSLRSSCVGPGPGPGLNTSPARVRWSCRPRGRWPGRGGSDRLRRGHVPCGDGDSELQRHAAGAVPQADETRAKEGEEVGHNGGVAAGACCVKARAPVDTLRREQKRLPARLDQCLRNLKIALKARDIEARASGLFCLEQKRLPARLDQCLCNLKMPTLAGDKEAICQCLS